MFSFHFNGLNVFVHFFGSPVHLSPLSMCKRLIINIFQHRELDDIKCIVEALPYLESLVTRSIPPNIMTKVSFC